MERSPFRRGAADGGRTRTALLPRDFKSRVSANFTTAAYQYSIVLAIPSKVKEEYRRSMGKKEQPFRAALSPGIPGVKQKTVGRDPPFFKLRSEAIQLLVELGQLGQVLIPVGSDLRGAVEQLIGLIREGALQRAVADLTLDE